MENQRAASRRLDVLSRQLSSTRSEAGSHDLSFGPCFASSSGPQTGLVSLRYSKEVQRALDAGEINKIVALESTIITHGMPYPQNYQTAIEVEAVIRKHGAVPATIAIIDGVVYVGLEDEQLRALATMEQSKVHKASRRDIAYVIANRLTASTTVATTSIIAYHLAKISIFATGGIGGVHRFGESTMDISADLTELGRTAITVVCAGAKSFLDIPRTLEYLETQGVAVIGYKTNEFPAFYVSKSGEKTPLRLDTPRQIAELIDSNHRLNLNSGNLLAVPITPEEEAESKVIDDAIHQALKDADAKGIKGKEITPFVLARVSDLTKGASLKANIALIKNNASVAAQIAVELHKLRKEKRAGNGFNNHEEVVIGASVVDVYLTPNPGDDLIKGTSQPGLLSISCGGVGRNVAEAIKRLKGIENPNTSPLLITALGGSKDDFATTIIMKNFSQLNLDTSGIINSFPGALKPLPTSFYGALMDKNGDLIYSIDDFQIIDHLSPNCFTNDLIRTILNAKLVFVDANLTENTLSWICDLCSKENIPLWFEPTSIPKSRKALPLLSKITFTSPNIEELAYMIAGIYPERVPKEPHEYSLLEIEQMIFELLKRGVENVVCTLGKNGVLLGRFGDFGKASFKHFTVDKDVKVVNVSGAGDTLVGATIHSLTHFANTTSSSIRSVVNSALFDHSIRFGIKCAGLSVQSPTTISHQITPSLFQEFLRTLE